MRQQIRGGALSGAVRVPMKKVATLDFATVHNVLLGPFDSVLGPSVLERNIIIGIADGHIHFVLSAG